jgi:hypothetical protein
MTTVAIASRTASVGVALCGLMGVVFLGVYYSVPLPLPSESAPIQEILDFSSRYHDRILFNAWLQASGSLLAVVFFVALVHLARGFERIAGWIALLGAGSVLAMSLLDVALVLGALQGATHGHVATVQTCFDLTYVFIHVFPIGSAAATFFGLGGVLMGSPVVPRGFAYSAFALAAAFEILGFIGLFKPAVNGAMVVLLGSQELWIAAAAVFLCVMAIRSRGGVICDS